MRGWGLGVEATAGTEPGTELTSLLGHLVWQAHAAGQLRARPSRPAVPWQPLAGGLGLSGGRPPAASGFPAPPLACAVLPRGLSSPWGASAPHSQVEVFKASPTPTRCTPYPAQCRCKWGPHARAAAGGGLPGMWREPPGMGTGWREPCWAHREAGASWKLWGTSSEWAVLWLPDAGRWCWGGGGGRGGQRLAVGVPVLGLPEWPRLSHR